MAHKQEVIEAAAAEADAKVEAKAEAEAVQPWPAHFVRDGVWREAGDRLVVEEPLEIRIGNRRFTATMRTPGDDFNLARGLLFAEGVIEANNDIAQMRWCDSGLDADSNILQVQLHRAGVEPHLWERNLISNASCGLCGKASIEALSQKVPSLPPGEQLAASQLLNLPQTMRRFQPWFDATGGLHAAAIFDATGRALCICEDIGRHNATDKAIGRGLSEGWLPHRGAAPLVLLVSGRASFEIVQKALMARIPIVAAVSAVSSMGAELAQANGQTLLGFLREGAFTVYAGDERLAR